MSTADWYARKMRGEANKKPINPLPPTPVASPPPSPPVTAVTTVPNPASSASSACPHCHGSNFGKPSPQVASRCFDCGYVDGRDYHQETFAPSRVDSVLNTKQMPVQQYAPQQIVGKID